MKLSILHALLVLLVCASQASGQQPQQETSRRSAVAGPLRVEPVSRSSLKLQSDAAREIQPTMPEDVAPQPIPDPSAGLTISDLENMAVAANPSISRAASLVEAARANWVQVGLPPNPQAGYEGQQIGSGGRAEQDGVFLEQEIVRGGKLRLNREVAAQEAARAEHALAAQRQRVLTDVHVNFYQVLVAQEQERLALDLNEIANEGLKVANDLLEQREVGRVDVLQSKLEVQNAAILARNARNRSIAAWRALTAVVGEPDLPPQLLVGDLNDIPTYEWDETLQRLLTNSPEIAIAMTNIERARWLAERARVEKTPNVTVRGLVNWRDNGIDGDPDGAISVGLPIPIWNKNQGGIVQARQQASAAERALYQLELDLQNRLAPVFERYSSSHNQVSRYREEILPTAKETLDLTRQLYSAGELGYLNLLTAQRSYFNTNLSYLDALRELRTATAEIDGLLLSNSLQSNPEAP